MISGSRQANATASNGSVAETEETVGELGEQICFPFFLRVPNLGAFFASSRVKMR